MVKRESCMVSVDLVHYNRRLDDVCSCSRNRTHFYCRTTADLQRHFESEDHTEFTFYLLLICAYLFVDVCYDHYSRTHFRHISRDS